VDRLGCDPVGAEGFGAGRFGVDVGGVDVAGARPECPGGPLSFPSAEPGRLSSASSG
jgi:hypothetical protein